MPIKSRALVLKGLNEPFELAEVEVSDPQEGEVLIKMVASGICHSDLSVQNGTLACFKWPTVLGHEGSGIVHKLGPGVTDLAVGDRVLLSFDYCKTCAPCKKHGPAACQQWFPLNFMGKRPDGSDTTFSAASNPSIAGRFFGQSSFSEYSIASTASCVKVDAKADLVQLAPLGCGIQTGAGAVLNCLKPESGESLAVWGLGGVGMSALLAAKALGCSPLIAVDVQPNRLALAKEFGATHVVNGKEDPKAEILKITGGAGLNYVVEATGVPACIGVAYDSLGLFGKHAQVGAPPVGTQPPIDLTMGTVLQKSFICVLEGNSDPPVFIAELVKMNEKGQLPLEKMSKVYKLEDFAAAIAAMKDGSVIKPILTF